MIRGLYVCEVCKLNEKDFRVPADSIGISIMQQHLKEEHDITRIHWFND